jgi:hypothetical protein
MRTRHRATINDLRMAIDCLPRATRIAMLEGIRQNEIIVGAYTHADGVCPMLAAHRAGGRTNLIGFAKAWDGLAFRGDRARRPRRATDRELLILTSHLEASLLEDAGAAPDLGEAVAEHRASISRRSDQRPSRRPGDPDRSEELRTRPGWSWMRVVRRYDEYERVLARLHSERETLERREHELV